MTTYIVQDGDTQDKLPRRGAVRMSQTVGWCELCGCYRNTPQWHTMHYRGSAYAACGAHTPIDRALWEAEDESREATERGRQS